MERKLNPDGPGSPPSAAGQGGLYVEPSIHDVPGPAPAGDLVKHGDMASFKQDVVDESASVPVIVDFWAPWCGPCKQLGPALEALVKQAGGLVKMVKINVDENQPLAQQMRVQSIPAVFAFKNGQPVDGFTGVVPESQLKVFVDKLLDGAKGPIDAALEQADAALDAGDGATAGSIYKQVQEHEPGNPKAIAGMIRAAMAIGDMALAQEMASNLPDDLRSQQEIAAAISALELAGLGGGADEGEVEKLRLASEARPDDHQARFDYASALIGGGRNEQGLDELFEIIRRNRTWNDDAARQQVLKVFEALGPTDPLTLGGRRKLSTILFS